MTLSLPRPAAPLWPLLPALALVPLALLLPAISHGGGWGLVGEFAAAALRPSLQPEVLRSVLQGLATTLAMAMLGWACSLGLGLLLGVASSRLVWEQGLGLAWPSGLVRRLLALPRAIHELIWGLALLQLLGLQPVVAVLAITIPFGALVARVVADQLDALPVRSLESLRSAGVPAGAALLTALGPPLLPQLLSYGGYRLECALRSATLLGVFGLGGLGTELRLTLQSLAFRELWSGLWALLLAMLLLEQLLGWLRRRWAMPSRLNLRPAGVGRSGRELVLAALGLIPLLLALGWGLGVNPAGLLRWQPSHPYATGRLGCRGRPALAAAGGQHRADDPAGRGPGGGAGAPAAPASGALDLGPEARAGDLGPGAAVASAADRAAAAVCAATRAGHRRAGPGLSQLGGARPAAAGERRAQPTGA
jgi:phosphonate transport system permease protein